jgi:transposase
MTVYTQFIGIDIGKFEVVTASHGSKTSITFPNTKEGFESFITRYDTKNSLIVLETTGGYEKLFLKALLEKKLAVHRANTRQTKAFIRSLGCKGKTDALDAIALARYGYERHDKLALYQQPENATESLQSLAQRRMDLNQLLVAEKNRLQSPSVTDFVKKSCQALIAAIEEQLQQVIDAMKAIINLHPEILAKKETIQEVPGVGEITAAMLVALVPELGHLNRRQIASLMGLAPYPNESGTKVGYRRTKGGREEAKKVLFMAAMSAAHSKSALGKVYSNMLERGKKKMVALVAIMRKIIVIANAKTRDSLVKQQVVKNAQKFNSTP